MSQEQRTAELIAKEICREHITHEKIVAAITKAIQQERTRSEAAERNLKEVVEDRDAILNAKQRAEDRIKAEKELREKAEKDYQYERYENSKMMLCYNDKMKEWEKEKQELEKSVRELEDIHSFIGKHFEICDFTGCDTKDCKNKDMQSWTLLLGEEGEADRYRCAICALEEIIQNAEHDQYLLDTQIPDPRDERIKVLTEALDCCLCDARSLFNQVDWAKAKSHGYKGVDLAQVKRFDFYQQALTPDKGKEKQG